MTVHHNPSASIVRHIPHARRIEVICNFVIRNADDLIWVATATGGHNGRAAASDLVDAVSSRTASDEDIHNLLVVVRDFLLSGSGRALSARTVDRPDLDAAVRWTGARIDDLIQAQA